MTDMKYVVTNPHALEDAIALEPRASLKHVMLLIQASPGKEIKKTDLIRQLDAVQPGLQARHPGALESRVYDAVEALVRRGAVQKEAANSFKDFAAQFGLTSQQFANYYRLLVYAGIFPANTHQHRMAYQPEVADVFNAAKQLYQNGVSYTEAFGVGIGAVFGNEKRRQFEESLRRNAEKRISERKRKRSLMIASEIAASGKIPSTTYLIRYAVMLEALADGRQADAAKLRESLEETVLYNWTAAGNYTQVIMSFPATLYFALKGGFKVKYKKQRRYGQKRYDRKGWTFPEEIRTSVRAAMEAAPLSETFEGYERSVHAGISEFWRCTAESIRAPLQEILDSVVEQAQKMLRESDDCEIRRTAKSLLGDFELLNARYVAGGRMKTLEEVGREYGITRECVRQHEAKALERLRGIPEVKEMLGRFGAV